MLAAPTPKLSTTHETVAAFEAIGYPLNKTLESMLNEGPEHQRPRRGCGYTQSGRFLADIINQPRDFNSSGDLRVFSEAGQGQILNLVTVAQSFSKGIPNGLSQLRATLESPTAVNPELRDSISQLNRLLNITETLEFEESRLLAALILSILGKEQTSSIPSLPHTTDKLAVGTCPEAERYFLEFAGGYVRRQGLINIFTDDARQPVAVEKINIGDSHSCITIRDTQLNGVLIPAGSLIGTKYTSLPITTQKNSNLIGAWLPLSACAGFRFLRPSTLSVSPRNRARAFGNHLQKQLEGTPFFDPVNTKLSDLAAVAQQQRPGYR